MLTLVMNPGKVYDWSLLKDGRPIASSNDGPFDNEDETLDAFDALKSVDFGAPRTACYSRLWAVITGEDLFLHNNHHTEEDAIAAYNEVVAFIKEY